MICKVCLEDKAEESFAKTRSYKGKVYRLKTCYKCNYKIRKSNGKTNWADTHREEWNLYQKEYARTKYYAYYEKRTKKNG